MIRIVCIVLFGAFSLKSYAVSSEMSGDTEDTICANYLYIDLSPIVYNKLKLTHEGVSHAFSKPLPTLELKVGYENKLNTRWSWGIDIAAGLLPFSIGYDFPAPDSSIFQANNPYELTFDRHYRKYIGPNLYAALTPSVNYSFPLNSKTSIYMGTAVRLYFFRYDQVDLSLGDGMYIDSSNTQLYDLFSATLRDTVSNEINASFQAKAGVQFLFSNSAYLKLGLVINASPRERLIGWYHFSNLGYISSGKLSQGFNYLGLNIQYGFPLKKRKSEKEEAVQTP